MSVDDEVDESFIFGLRCGFVEIRDTVSMDDIEYVFDQVLMEEISFYECD